jgi:hypothetical protein
MGRQESVAQPPNSGHTAIDLCERRRTRENREVSKPNYWSVNYGKWLDTRSTGAAGGADPHLETVEAGHRAPHA